MEKEWFEKLTDAQKTKLRGLGGTAEELIAFCKEEKLDLPDDLLETVNGGGFCLDNCLSLGKPADLYWVE